MSKIMRNLRGCAEVYGIMQNCAKMPFPLLFDFLDRYLGDLPFFQFYIHGKLLLV